MTLRKGSNGKVLAECPSCGVLHTPTSKERVAGRFRCPCKTSWTPPAEELEIVKKGAAAKSPGKKEPPDTPKSKQGKKAEPNGKNKDSDDYWGRIGL